MPSLHQSLRFYLMEKYYSIFSELYSLNAIVYFYYNKGILDDNIVQATKDFFKEIENTYERFTAKFTSGNFYRILIDIDYERSILEEVLLKYEMLHEKVIQTIFENSSHIHPLPPILKRYSSKVLSSILENHHQEIMKLFGNDNQKIFAKWSHQEAYSIPTIGGTTHFSQHSFYYHDLVWIIPSVIDHEVILKTIQSNEVLKRLIAEQRDNIVSSIIGKLQEIIKQSSLDPNKKSFFQEYIDFIDSNTENILWELTADFIGVSLYGDHYKLSFFHETLGKFFGREFYKGDEFIHHISMGASPRRDALLVRHIVAALTFGVALGAYPKLNDNQVLKDIVDGFKKMITDNSFWEWMGEDAAANNPGSTLNSDRWSAKQFCNVLRIFIHNFGTFTNEVLSSKISAILPNDKVKAFKEQSPFFNENGEFNLLELWTDRFSAIDENKILHRSILRKKLVNNISGATVSTSAYVLSYRYAMGSFSKIDQGGEIAFGSHKSIAIEKKDGKIYLEKEIEAIKTNFNDNKYQEAFMAKHALLLIGDKKKTNNNFTLYMLVYLKDNNHNNIIKLALKIKKDNASCNVYKSFGPEDIVIEASFESDSEIWKFVEGIRSTYEGIAQTFTSITTAKKKFESNTWIKSHYVTLPTLTFKNFYDKAHEIYEERRYLADNKMQIFNIADKFYDFEVWWNQVSLDDISYFQKQLGDALISVEHFIVSNEQLNGALNSSQIKKGSSKGVR